MCSQAAAAEHLKWTSLAFGLCVAEAGASARDSASQRVAAAAVGDGVRNVAYSSSLRLLLL